ncbi:hypothetical protein GCM10008096_11860 [Zhihengliuella salsuginis]|uniref:HTH luxR-type domain-containing protein n=2 Tax=Zhihengliuella salsuginis TaxID=578222 RepID=A0ABQ3GH90_9MICC|nr:hypothetical protein GCM10008096_11860 [Zhihengliuella salsuginis]
MWSALRDYLDWPRKFASLESTDRSVPGSAVCQLVPGLTPEMTEDVAGAVAYSLSVLDTFEEPTIIILENAQWTDPVSTAVMSGILPYLGNYPVLFIGTVRPCMDESAQQLVRAALAPATSSYIALPPLEADQTRESLESMLGVPVGRDIARRFHEATGGLPLLLEEAARALHPGRHDAHAVAEALDVFESRTARRVRDFDASVADSLSYLTPTARQVLRLLSLSPDSLTAAQLQQACALTDLRAADLLPLQDSDFIRWDPVDYGYHVSLVPIGQAVRHMMMPDEIAECHRALGEAGDLAAAPLHRFLGQHPEALGGRVAPGAGDIRVPAEIAEDILRLLDRREHARVVAYLNALARVSPGDDTLALALLARWREPRENLWGPIRLAMRGARCPLLLAVARAVQHFTEAHYEAAVAELTRAGSVEVESPAAAYVFLQAVDRVGRTDAVRGTLHQSRDLRRVAARHLERLAAELEDPAPEDIPLEGFALRERLATLRASFALWEELADLAPALQDVRPGMFAELSRRQAGVLEGLPDSEEDALAVRVHAAARARDFGDRASVIRILGHRTVVEAGSDDLAADAYCHLALTYFDAGQFARAAEFGGLARAQAFGSHNAELLLTAEAVGVLVDGARGGREAVAPLLDELAESSDVVWLPFVRLAAAYVRAWAAMADEDYDDVVSALSPVSDNVLGWQPLGMVSVALLARAQYYSGSAVLAGEGLALVDEHGIGAMEPVAEFVTGYLRALASAEAEPRRAAGEFAAALEVADKIPGLGTGAPDGRGGGFRLYRALAAHDFGRLVARCPDELREYMPEAYRAALSAQQLWITSQAGGLRRATDVVVRDLRAVLDGRSKRPPDPDVPRRPAPPRPRQSERAATQALEKLTAREREIAVLIGRGLTNKEVADRLVISVRTAEYHAANIARNLRLGSRAEVREVFAGE